MKRFGGYVAAAMVLALVIALAASRWFDSRIKADFWPFDRSFVGPNLVASVVQWAVLALLVVVLYPPIRHWFEAEFHRGRQHVSEELSQVHAKLDHVIQHHPDIPPFEPKP